MRPLLLCLLLLTAPFALAASTTRLVAGSESRLVLEGSSNLAAWRCSGTSLDGQMEVGAPVTTAESVMQAVSQFTLRVPIATLRCGNRQMERDMNRALRAAAHPSIEFEFTDLVRAVQQNASGTFAARIQGILSLAGTRRTITLDVEVEPLSGGRYLLRARMPLRMTDFRVTPPTALFGMIKANDALTVHFDLVLEHQP